MPGFAFADDIDDEDGESVQAARMDLPRSSATRNRARQILKTPPKKVSVWPLVVNDLTVVI
jgi:hypothetical protein